MTLKAPVREPMFSTPDVLSPIWVKFFQDITVGEETAETFGESLLLELSSVVQLYDIVRSFTKVVRNTTTTTINYSAYQWNGDTDVAGFTYTLPIGSQDKGFKIVNVGTSGNVLTISPDGTENLIGENEDFYLQDGESLIINYDETDGWY